MKVQEKGCLILIGEIWDDYVEEMCFELGSF